MFHWFLYLILYSVLLYAGKILADDKAISEYKMDEKTGFIVVMVTKVSGFINYWQLHFDIYYVIQNINYTKDLWVFHEKWIRSFN